MELPSVIRTASVLAVLCLSVILSACTQADRILFTLRAAIIATEVALPQIAAANDLSPAVALTINEYLDGVNDAAIRATNILGNNGYTPAEKTTAIVAAFATVAFPRLPDGTPQKVALTLNAVARAVDIFLGTIRATEAEIRVSHPEMIAGFDKGAKKPLTQKELKKLQREAERVKRKIAEARKRM